jgi:hypothetical protein
VAAVGILTAFRPGIRRADLRAAADYLGSAALPSGAWSPAMTPGTPVGLASPFSTSTNLARVAFSELFPDLAASRPLDRAQAMAVPAVARARHIIAGTIARIPLRGYQGDTALAGPAAPPWIDRTSGQMSPFHRMLWTVDDLLFFGWSCWSRVNSTMAPFFPLQMDRIPMGAWAFDDAGRVLVDRGDGAGFVRPEPNSTVLIPGPHEGLLSFGQPAIRHARDLHKAAGTAARHPAAMLVLKQVGGTPLTPEQKSQLISDWAMARDGENGGVAYLNQSMEAQELGTFDQHLVVDGRNAAAVDVARAASIPADLIDASPAHADLTYQNSRDNDRRFVDYGLGLYISAISGALSQDGITARGQRVAFDIEGWLAGTVPGQPTPPTPPAPAAVTTSPPIPQQPTPAPAVTTTTGEPPQ